MAHHSQLIINSHTHTHHFALHSKVKPPYPSKMVRITSVVVALAATITGTQAAFKQACTAPYDVCGWTLTDNVRGMSSALTRSPTQRIPSKGKGPYANRRYPGYEQSELVDAARRAGQDVSNVSVLYNAVYNCHADGVIEWNRPCANGCNAAGTVPNANCRP